jgi:hypothetical protein
MEINSSGPSPLSTARPEAPPRREPVPAAQTAQAVEPSSNSGQPATTGGQGKRGQNLDITV